MTHSRVLGTVFVAIVLLAGCNASSVSPLAASTSALTSGGSTAGMPADGGGHVLYIANEGYPHSVSVYGGRKRSLLRTITDDITSPVALAVNRTGHLYVANYIPRHDDTVTEYGKQGRQFVKAVSHLPFPSALALDSAGNLYALRLDAVDVYANGKAHLMRSIHVQGLALALDASGNLYVGTRSNAVNVYSPRSKTPSRTISNGISSPSALAFDAAGNLYVANYLGGQNCGNHYGGSVTVYAPGGSAPVYTISASQGICNPFRLAIDSGGNLYVSNGAPGSVQSSVTVYAPGGSTLLRTITQGVDGPWAIAVDPAGFLYVANQSSGYAGTVTIYAPGSTSLVQTISNGPQSYPEALAIGK